MTRAKIKTYHIDDDIAPIIVICS